MSVRVRMKLSAGAGIFGTEIRSSSPDDRAEYGADSMSDLCVNRDTRLWESTQILETSHAYLYNMPFSISEICVSEGIEIFCKVGIYMFIDIRLATKHPHC